MDGQVAIDTETLSWAQSRLVGAHDDLVERRAVVEAEARGLLTDGWRGVAAQQYADAWDRWRVAADQVLASMLDLGAAMAFAEAQLEVVDLEAAGGAARLRARLADR